MSDATGAPDGIRSTPAPPPPGLDEPAEARAPDATVPPVEAPPGRRFTVDGEEWTVSVTGDAVGGTGRSGAAYFIALHFQPARADLPPRQLLTHNVRLSLLFDEELAELLARARPVPPIDY